MNILKKNVFTKSHIKVLEAGFDLLVLHTDIKLAKIAKTHTAFKLSFPQPSDIPSPKPRSTKKVLTFPT